MEISDFGKLSPAHLIQIIVVSTFLVICIIGFINEVIREFPYIKEILKGRDINE